MRRSNVDNGPTPLTVQFSSDGSQDPDGTPLTYAWDFDGNGTTDSTLASPTHTYTTAGTFNATLTVTDGDGQTAFDTIPITAGNTRPTVTITIPDDGQFAAFGDIVPYEITVTDPEDGTVDCNRVTLSWQLGHDDHAHGLGEQTGCSGTFRTATDSGHGANANIFTSIVATYTDNAQGAANALTGRDEAVLQPKPKQAEFFESTGRVAGSPAGGDPGVQIEATTDAGGGSNIGFIEHGDYVSYERVSLEELTGIRFRVASGGAGGTIEARLDSPTGPLVGSVAVAPTGGWQNWANVTMDLPTPPSGTHELFLVFTHASDNGGLFNLNYFTALGKGAANSAAPEVTASAEPTSGDAPLTVQFTGTATDPDAGAGEQMTYLWDFGVAGSTTDTSTELSPSYTYERPGHVPGALHGDRPERGVRDRERPGRGHELERVPAEQRQVRRVRGRLARHQPLADHPAGQHASADRVGRQPELPDRRRLALRTGHVGQEHHRPAAARRRRRGDGEDHDRAADRQLPAGRPAGLPGRQQLGLGPHDLRRRQP